jgi:hypothetical protein
VSSSLVLTEISAGKPWLERHCEPTGRANARPMTDSAKRSRAAKKERVDCFVASLLAMTRERFVAAPIPDKAMSQPSLRRGTVGFSPTLHDELKGRAAAAG